MEVLGVVNSTDKVIAAYGTGIGSSINSSTLNDNNRFTAQAGASVSGHRVVGANNSSELFHIANNVIDHAFRYVGLSENASSIGGDVTAVRYGPITFSGWSFTADEPVYLGLDGLLTQTVPGNPALFILIVGIALTATTINVDFQPPIFLE